MQGSLTNFAGSTLTGGRYVVKSRIVLTGPNVRTLAADLVLDGASSAVVNTSGGNALANLDQITSAGALTLGGGRSFSTPGTLTTAYLALRMCLGLDFKHVVVPFDEILNVAERGECYRLLKRYDEAIADFNRALELNPRDSWTLSRRGAAYQAMQIFEEAFIDLTRAVEIDPENAWAWAQRGSLFRQM